MDRKEFFSKALLGGSVLFFAPAVLNSCSKTSSDPATVSGGITSGGNTLDLTASGNAALNTVGGFVYSGNIIIIRTGDTSYTALSKVCTHQGCTVSYNKSSNRLVCPCHGAQFNTGGSVLQGPASRALTSYTVTVNGNTLTIS